MFIVAKSKTGAEFLYSPRSAHKVSKASAARIARELNEIGYTLPCDGSAVWAVHEIDEYTTAYAFAVDQAFYINRGNLCRKARHMIER